MNENLPVHVATNLSEVGTISYANEVIAIIAGMAAAEIEGVAAMGSTTSSIADILGRGSRKPVTRGVKVEVGSEEASVDVTLTVEYGKPIQKVCCEVQESVRKSIETMTGLHVVKVDVHVMGVSFERETQQIAEGSQHAKMDNVVLKKEKDIDYMNDDSMLDDLDTDLPELDDEDEDMADDVQPDFTPITETEDTDAAPDHAKADA